MTHRSRGESGASGDGVEMSPLHSTVDGQGGGGGGGGAKVDTPEVNSDSILRPADFCVGESDLAGKLQQKFNETLDGITLNSDDKRSLVEGPKAGRLARAMEARQVRVVTQRNQHYTRAEMVIAADGAKQRHEPIRERNKRLFMSVTSCIGPVDRACYGSPEAKIFVVNVPAGQYGRATINDKPMLLASGTHVITGSLQLGDSDVASLLEEEVNSNREEPLRHGNRAKCSPGIGYFLVK